VVTNARVLNIYAINETTDQERSINAATKTRLIIIFLIYLNR